MNKKTYLCCCRLYCCGRRTKENQGDFTVANSIMSARYDCRHNHGGYCVAQSSRASRLLRKVFHVRNTRITIALLSRQMGSTDPGLLRSCFVEKVISLNVSISLFCLFFSFFLYLFLSQTFTYEKTHRVSKQSTMCRAV